MYIELKKNQLFSQELCVLCNTCFHIFLVKKNSLITSQALRNKNWILVQILNPVNWIERGNTQNQRANKRNWHKTCKRERERNQENWWIHTNIKNRNDSQSHDYLLYRRYFFYYIVYQPNTIRNHTYTPAPNITLINIVM